MLRKGRSTEGTSGAEESGGEKKEEKENQLKRTKSRELRGGIMYYSCHCIKRNGLQHDCRRTGCGGEPACLAMPDPLCAPSQLARARGLADPSPLAAHMRAQGGGVGAHDSAGGSVESAGPGKRFIVCELKGITPDISADKSGKCCKCSVSGLVPPQGPKGFGGAGACILANVITSLPAAASNSEKKCPCRCDTSSTSNSTAMFVFDEKMMKKILSSFDNKDVAKNDDIAVGLGSHSRKVQKTVAKEEPCTRPGCVHWQPPPPCLWDAPCKADCFETPPGIQPGRNPLTSGGGGGGGGGYTTSPGSGKATSQQPREVMKLLTPNYCTGCSAPSGGAAASSGGGGPAAGLPVLVMKLC